jgi:hypothetical protein
LIRPLALSTAPSLLSCALLFLSTGVSLSRSAAH